MEVTLKNSQILGAMNSIGELLQLEDLSTKLNYSLNKNIMKFEDVLKTFTKCEKELADKYILKDEQGEFRLDDNNEPRFAPNDKKKYLSEREELLNCEESVDVHYIKLSAFPENIGRGGTLYNIMFLIKEDEV